jgi:DNA-directed RNA polymerase specialized sigma24 family protein
MENAPLHPDFAAHLERARSGSAEDLGILCENVRIVLRRKARCQLKQRLQAKEQPSDLVQETFLAVQKDLDQFNGKSPEEFLSWVISILAHKMRKLERQYGPGTKRDILREVSLEGSADLDAAPHAPTGRPCAKKRPLHSVKPWRTCPRSTAGWFTCTPKRIARSRRLAVR